MVLLDIDFQTLGISTLVSAILSIVCPIKVYNWQQRGRVIIDQKRATVVYSRDDKAEFIKSVNGTLVFINNSGHPKTVKVYLGFFYNGKEYTSLGLEQEKLDPTFVVEAKKLQEYNFNFTRVGLIDLQDREEKCSEFYISLFFWVGKSLRKEKIECFDIRYELSKGGNSSVAI